MSLYYLIMKQKPDLSYIRILRSLYYTLIFKIIKGRKNFNNKFKKGILIRFKSFNNFIIYILEDNKVIITWNIVIKEGLNYKEDYKLEKDYNTFLKVKSLDYNDYISIYNKETINNNENNEDIYNNNELSLFIIFKQVKVYRIINKEIINQNDDLNELNLNYKYTTSSKSLILNNSLNIIQLNIYNLTSLTYLNSLN